MSGIYWSMKWQATPVFLPGKFHGQRNLVSYRPWVAQGQTQLSTHTVAFTYRSTTSSLNNDTTIASCKRPGGTSLRAQSIKNPPAMRETRVQSLSLEDPLEKEMATHASILDQRIPWTEEPDGLQSMGSQRVGHD